MTYWNIIPIVIMKCVERERVGSDGIVMKIRRKVPIQKTERNDTSTSLVYLASNFW